MLGDSTVEKDGIVVVIQNPETCHEYLSNYHLYQDSHAQVHGTRVLSRYLGLFLDNINFGFSFDLSHLYLSRHQLPFLPIFAFLRTSLAILW